MLPLEFGRQSHFGYHDIMATKNINSYRVRVIIFLITLGTIPFLIPKSQQVASPAPKAEEAVSTESKIVVLTNEAGRQELINKVISFREQHPKVGIVLIMDKRALAGKEADICMLDPKSDHYTQHGKCFINRNKTKLVQEFATTINSK